MALIEGPPPYPRHDGWEETAKWHSKNEDFYRNIVHEIGELLGPEVYVADDGSVMEDVLALKVPEVLRERLYHLRNCRDISGTEGTWNHDEYMRGMFNGLELAVSCMENREPQFKRL